MLSTNWDYQHLPTSQDSLSLTYLTQVRWLLTYLRVDILVNALLLQRFINGKREFELMYKVIDSGADDMIQEESK